MRCARAMITGAPSGSESPGSTSAMSLLGRAIIGVADCVLTLTWSEVVWGVGGEVGCLADVLGSGVPVLLPAWRGVHVGTWTAWCPPQVHATASRQGGRVDSSTARE